MTFSPVGWMLKLPKMWLQYSYIVTTRQEKSVFRTFIDDLNPWRAVKLIMDFRHLSQNTSARWVKAEIT